MSGEHIAVRLWRDPVWSKVIAAGIIALSALGISFVMQKPALTLIVGLGITAFGIVVSAIGWSKLDAPEHSVTADRRDGGAAPGASARPKAGGPVDLEGKGPVIVERSKLTGGNGDKQGGDVSVHSTEASVTVRDSTLTGGNGGGAGGATIEVQPGASVTAGPGAKITAGGGGH